MNTYSIRNILVAVDLSETSLNAVETAVALAKKHKAALHLFHVAETVVNPGDNDLDLYATADVLSAVAGAITHKHDVEPNVIGVEGHVAEAIVKASLQLSADLIVMGTHGASGYRDGFIGGNAYRVIKYSSCPVLTIPPKRKVTSFQKILFPIRPVAGALMRYDTVASFLVANASIDVVGLSYHAMEGETNVLDKIVEEIMQQLKKSSTRANTFWGSVISVPDAVLQHAQQSSPDLLIITSHLDVITKPNYIGPHAQKIIHQSRFPVLIIKKMGVPAFA